MLLLLVIILNSCHEIKQCGMPFAILEDARLWALMLIEGKKGIITCFPGLYFLPVVEFFCRFLQESMKSK